MAVPKSSGGRVLNFMTGFTTLLITKELLFFTFSNGGQWRLHQIMTDNGKRNCIDPVGVLP